MGDDSKDKKALIDSDLWPVFFAGLALAFVMFIIFAHFNNHEEVRNYTLALGAVVLGPIGLWLTFRRTAALEQQNENTLRSLDQQEKRDRDTRLATAFSQAVEQLGHKSQQVRAGAIHSIAAVMLEDRQRYYPAGMDIMCGFLRSRAREALLLVNGLDESSEFDDDTVTWPRGRLLPTDIDAVVSSISRVNEKTSGGLVIDGDESSRHRINLEGADLRCFRGLTKPINFSYGVLRGVNFRYAMLANSDFSYSDLSARPIN